jgi:hypothetical protein
MAIHGRRRLLDLTLRAMKARDIGIEADIEKLNHPGKGKRL